MAELQTGQDTDQVAPEAGAQGQQGVQSQGAVQGDDGFVRIPRTNYAALAPDGDFNKVVHMGKQWRDFEQGGWHTIQDYLKELNSPIKDGYQLREYLRQLVESEAQQQAAQTGGTQPQGAAQQGYLSPEQVKEMVARQVTEALTGYRKEQDTSAARQAEQAAYMEELKKLGYEPTPQKLRLGEAEMDVDPYHEFIMQPALQAMAQRLYERTLNPNDPDYATKLNAPVDRQMVTQAAAALGPYLKSLGQQRQEALADKQAKLPNESVAGGPGGRVKQATKDMTPEDRKQEVFNRAKKKLQGQYT